MEGSSTLANGRTGRGHVLRSCVFLVFASLLFAPTAVAGVAFVPEQPLRVSWHELEVGKRVGVCNGTSRRLSSVTIRLSSFLFMREGKPIAPPSRILATRLLASVIVPGSCVPVLLRAPHGAKLDPGEYSGTLVLAAIGAGVTRLRATVLGPPPRPATPSAVAEGETLSQHDVTPLDGSAASNILLRAPGGGEAPIKIGATCNGNGDSPTRNARCPWLGNLYQGTNVVSVVVRGAARRDENESIQALPIELQFSGSRRSGHPVGTYEGTVDLAEGGVSHPIKLKVDFKDAWYCAVLALLLGTLIALAPQLYEGRFRPKSVLETRKTAAGMRYAGTTPPGYPGIKVDSDDVSRYFKGVEEAIRDYSRTVILFDVASAAYVEIDKALKLAEEDQQVLFGDGGLGPSLSALSIERDHTTQLLKEKEVSDVPELLSLASGTLAVGQLGVGEAAKRRQRADELVELMRRWRALTARVLEYVVWLKKISAAGATRAALPARDAETLAHAGVNLFSVRRALFEEVASEADLTNVRSSGLLEPALGSIAYLGNKLGVDKPPPDTSPKKVGGDKALADVGYDTDPSLPAVTPLVVKGAAAKLNVTPAKPVDLPSAKRRLFYFDILALGIAMTVAIIGGLSAFYFGKSFGTLADYLTVIFTGTAIQLVAKAVLQQLEVFVHPIVPISRTRPATVTSVVPASAPTE
jgi:hypothetical protein